MVIALSSLKELVPSVVLVGWMVLAWLACIESTYRKYSAQYYLKYFAFCIVFCSMSHQGKQQWTEHAALVDPGVQIS